MVLYGTKGYLIFLPKKRGYFIINHNAIMESSIDYRKPLKFPPSKAMGSLLHSWCETIPSPPLAFFFSATVTERTKYKSFLKFFFHWIIKSKCNIIYYHIAYNILSLHLKYFERNTIILAIWHHRRIAVDTWQFLEPSSFWSIHYKLKKKFKTNPRPSGCGTWQNTRKHQIFWSTHNASN